MYKQTLQELLEEVSVQLNQQIIQANNTIRDLDELLEKIKVACHTRIHQTS